MLPTQIGYYKTLGSLNFDFGTLTEIFCEFPACNLLEQIFNFSDIIGSERTKNTWNIHYSCDEDGVI